MTAYIKTSNDYIINSDNVSATGNVVAPYFIGDGSLLTGITTSGNGIASGSSNVAIPNAGGNIDVTVGGVADVAVFTTTGVDVTGTFKSTGDITTGGFFIGDGSQLTNITASGSKIANGTSNVDIASINGNVSVSVGGTGNVVVVAATGEYVAGEVSATGNITGSYILGNGALLTGVVTSTSGVSNGTSNVNIATTNGNVTFGVNGTSNVVVVSSNQLVVSGAATATGNVTASYFIGDGSQLTGINASGNGISKGSTSFTIPSDSSNIFAIVNNVAVANVTSIGLEVNGIVSASGNVTGSNVVTNGNLIAVNGYVEVGNGLISTSTYDGGFIDGIVVDYQEGNGRISVGGLDGLNIYNNGVGDTQIASIGIDGSISSAGNIIAAGNLVTDHYILGNGYYLSGLSSITYGNANVESFLQTYSGNISAGNISVATTTYTKNIASSNGANVVNLNTTANVAGNVNVTGNVNGNLVGNTTGTHNGLVYSIDIRYLSWDFGSFTGAYTNPIQYLLDHAGGIDMGTILAPSSTNIDIGPITSTP